jgi:O-antigen/teichoic acid export membrane protein
VGFRSSLRTSSALRGILVISSGTLFGQVVIALSTPLLSQMYSPEAFGAYSAMLAIAGTVGPAAALKFDSAILLPVRDEDARGVLVLSLLSTVAVSLLSTFAMLFVGPWAFESAWHSVSLAPIWVGLLVLTTGVFSCLVQAVLRAKAYSLVGWRSTVQSIGISVAQIGFGFINPQATWLLGGMVVGRTMGFGALIRGVRPLITARGGAKLGVLIRKYWRSPAILAPSSLLNAFGTQLPLVIVMAWFGPAAAGQLGMAQRLVFLPAALLGAAFGQVFGAELAERIREESGGGRPLYLRATVRMSVLAALMCTCILILAPWFLPWFLGNQWEQSGLFAQGMAVSASLGLIVSPLSQVYLIHQSSASLVVDLSRVVFILISAIIVQLLNVEVVWAIWILYAAQVLNYVATWMYGLRIVSRGGKV